MKRFALALAALAVLAAGGVAYATIPDGQGVIHACYKTTGGQLRVIDSGSCSGSEKALSWRQSGAALGFYTRRITDAVPAQQALEGPITCDAGDLATGGGMTLLGSDLRISADEPWSDVPGGSSSGWQFEVSNPGTSPEDVRVTVVCVHLG
jgi:hypothetical protein